jgi:HNH endonuclease
MKPHRIPAALARLNIDWTKVRINGQCWIWTGLSGGSWGYGRIRFQGKQKLLHRVVWEVLYGYPKDRVLHSCDQPRCFNPNHLFAGSQAENLADMARKGRSCRGERNHFARLTPELVKKVRALREEDHTYFEIGQILDISKAHARDICIGRRWKHLTPRIA